MRGRPADLCTSFLQGGYHYDAPTMLDVGCFLPALGYRNKVINGGLANAWSTIPLPNLALTR